MAATSQGSARSHSSRSAHVVPFPVRPCGHGPHLQHSALDLELMMIFLYFHETFAKDVTEMSVLLRK